MSGSLGEREMLREHEPQATSVSSAFLSSPKHSQVFLWLGRSTENMFCISFRKFHGKKKQQQLVYFDHNNLNYLCSRHHYVKSMC